MTKEAPIQAPILSIETEGAPPRRVPLLRMGHHRVGRAPECEIVIHDLRVSREHFTLELNRQNRLEFTQLGSKNPVYINGFRRDEATLSYGDVIEVGRTTLRVQDSASLTPSRPDGSSSVRFVDRPLSSDSEQIRISTQFTEAPLGEFPAEVAPGRLLALCRLGELVAGTRQLDALFRGFAEELIQNLPAQRGFIALGDPNLDQFDVVKVVSTNQSESGVTIEMSETILEEIQIRRESLLVRDARSKFQATSDESIESLGIEAFMCAPMLIQDRFLGMLYLDQRTDAPRPFEKHDLHYLQTLARLLALAMDERLAREQLERELSGLREEFRQDRRFLAYSDCMQSVVTALQAAGRNDQPQLILGESGVGKRRVARLIHEQSARAKAPCVVVSCATSNERELEQALYGTDEEPGQIARADTGTLVLAELPELPAALQTRLLQTLEEQVLTTLDGTSRSIDVRAIATSSLDLRRLRKQKQLQSDLVLFWGESTLEVPPLRERGEDIARIAESLLPEEVEIHPAAQRALLAYEWPGNLPELQSTMEQAAQQRSGDRLRLQDLPDEIRRVSRRDRVELRIAPLAEVESRQIRRALDAFGGNKKRTAEALGISRETLYQKIKNYDL